MSNGISLLKTSFESIQFYIFCTFKCLCDRESSHHARVVSITFLQIKVLNGCKKWSGILGNVSEKNGNANVSNLLTSAEHKDEKRLIRGQLVV